MPMQYTCTIYTRESPKKGRHGKERNIDKMRLKTPEKKNKNQPVELDEIICTGQKKRTCPTVPTQVWQRQLGQSTNPNLNR